MNHTIYGYESYRSSAPIDTEKECNLEVESGNCIRGILFAAPFSIILWLLLVCLVLWLVK